MTENPQNRFSPPSQSSQPTAPTTVPTGNSSGPFHAPHHEGSDGQRRHRGGGGDRNRGRGGSGGGGGGFRNPPQTPQYSDPSDGPTALDLEQVSHVAQPLPTHHDKIELPPAFAALGLETALLYALADIKFQTPSEIQEKFIPIALTGADVLGQARTGTGKTAAFGLPILQKLDLAQPFQAIIVVPTRELAVQVEAEMVRFAKHKPIRFGLCYGGTKISGQLKLLGRHPHVIVGTPGRLIDVWERGALPLSNMRFVVCDEVDRMFDIGFRDDIRKILTACSAPHQTMFVSATISDDIERMVSKHMHDPQRVFTANKDESLTVAEAQQYFVGVNPWDKQRAIKLLIRQEKPTLALIFCRTKRSVDKVAEGLTRDGIAASPIHGDLMQNKRERVMRGFKTGKIHVLVATDLASRGIDVHEITHVINYDIPEDPEAYVHRVGRTARMGASGKAFTFVAHGQAQMQTEIEKLINRLLEEYRIEGFIASPEPGNRHPGESGHGGGAPRAMEPHESGSALHTQQSREEQAAAAEKPPVQEGYQPTGFANVQPTEAAALRPLSGRYYSKRRR